MDAKGIIHGVDGDIEIYGSRLICVKRWFDWHQMRFCRASKVFEYSEIRQICLLMPTAFSRGCIEVITDLEQGIFDRGILAFRDSTADNVITIFGYTKSQRENVRRLYHLILDLKSDYESSVKKQMDIDGKMSDSLHPDRWIEPISLVGVKSGKANDSCFENINQRVTPISASYTPNSGEKGIYSKFSKSQLTPFAVFSSKVVGVSYYQENFEKLIRALKATNLIEQNVRYYDSGVRRYYSGSRIYEFNLHQDFGNMVLEHEPDNPHDANAIKVMIYADNDRAYFIGYIPRDLTHIVAPIIDDPDFARKYYTHYFIGGGNYKRLGFGDRATGPIYRRHINYFAHLEIIKY
ncbi:HIRAN domain-containing protein [Companilactobacillus furfuricola]|uniref:HIRAN domain-containing protein n=1 Tax=Companilactobacillus furfuricola TaxID=1462575 RepID=UPI0013DE445C|nr:HIRAN domain-containing protein [Companilactobacillus furfuricola]